MIQRSNTRARKSQRKGGVFCKCVGWQSPEGERCPVTNFADMNLEQGKCVSVGKPS